ncbi:MAG: hypothetical protein IKA78_02935, partial [Oscillospiraceae bacterium]|nr:hypothetical protein [Oscillospiraceae bacterium]
RPLRASRSPVSSSSSTDSKSLSDALHPQRVLFIARSTDRFLPLPLGTRNVRRGETAAAVGD